MKGNGLIFVFFSFCGDRVVPREKIPSIRIFVFGSLYHIFSQIAFIG